MNAKEWIERFARELGAEPPAQEEIDAILELAATAAHNSERISAPIACWIGSASGRSLEQLNEIATAIEGN